MTEPDQSDPPSPFIERWARALLTTLPPARRLKGNASVHGAPT
jgi:hypothetical protein